MDFEAILPIVFLIIWVLTTLFGKAAQKKVAREKNKPFKDSDQKKNEQSKGPNLFSELMKAMESVNTQLQSNNPQTPSIPKRKTVTAEQKKNRIQNQKTYRETVKSAKDQKRRERLGIKDELPSYKKPKTFLEEGDDLMSTEDLKKTKIGLSQNDPIYGTIADTSKTYISKPTTQRLREAIIWSEILGKPTSLKTNNV